MEYQFVRDERNRAALYFARGEGRTVRQMQSLLRTLTSRWGENKKVEIFKCDFELIPGVPWPFSTPLGQILKPLGM